MLPLTDHHFILAIWIKGRVISQILILVTQIRECNPTDLGGTLIKGPTNILR